MNLAYNFARHVIAVSIEKLPMLALVSMGCDYGQGFLRGQPLPERAIYFASPRSDQGRSLDSAAQETERRPA
jgi:EAL domain-containing protein (putative c-di-GMP-specific phosphodiesterase class I)